MALRTLYPTVLLNLVAARFTEGVSADDEKTRNGDPFIEVSPAACAEHLTVK